MSVTYAKALWARIKRSPREPDSHEWLDEYIERSLVIYDEIERAAHMPSAERPDRTASGPDSPRPMPKFARARR